MTAKTHPAIEQLINNLDLVLFRHISSQTTMEDRRALLSLQKITRTHFGPYVYLEIASHLGGSIQPHLDPRPRVPFRTCAAPPPCSTHRTPPRR